jgi:hypothetical protein
MLLPKDNLREIDRTLAGIEIVPIASVSEATRTLAVHKKSTRRPNRGRRSSSARP